MINWRRPILTTLLRLSGSDVPQRLRRIHRMCAEGAEAVQRVQKERLEALMRFAWENTPYYKEALGKAKVVESGGQVRLERLEEVPFLTKEIIVREFDRLKSRDIASRRWSPNSSGGSTGEPVTFLQDRDYENGTIAATLFFFSMAGKEMGERELKLWGSERDIFEGSIGWREKTRNWLYHRMLLNSFRMGERELGRYVAQWNAFRPKVVWSYVDSAYELARFVEAKGLEIYSPRAIILTAGTLAAEMRRYIEKVLKTTVLNQYGSREVGGIAAECPHQHGLHLFEWKQFVEIIGPQGQRLPPGQEGEIAVTNLENYVMPMIRFRIGDRGILGVQQPSCKYPLRVLEKVTGRITNHFVRPDGQLIHGEYFTHLFYFRPWVKRFQVAQKALDLVICYVVGEKEKSAGDAREITEKIRLVMGENCRVEFQFVPEIPPLRSGKYLFTVSEVLRPSHPSPAAAPNSGAESGE